ncbi:MAG TPA: SPFH/Band 7/PHB domain protein, partial [Archangium sp.]
PQIVGAALQRIAQDPAIATAMFEILELQRLQESTAKVTLIPEGQKSDLLAQLLVAAPTPSR